MFFNLGRIRDQALRMHFTFNKPYYYRYAEKYLGCDCPTCLCPSRDKQKYSFVYTCNKRRVIYFDVPKCASSTIRKIIFKNNNTLSLKNPKLDLDNYFKFSFVRNPWDRMVSNWKMFTTHPLRIKQLKSMTPKDLSQFDDFVRFTMFKMNHHWQPQVLFLPEKLDFLGKLENFQTDFANVCEHMNLDVPKSVKHNATNRRPYWEYYTPELVELVSRFYADDIEQFSYTFGEEIKTNDP